MTGNPKPGMGSANQVLDKIPDKKRGTGVVLCFIDIKTYLRENLIWLTVHIAISKPEVCEEQGSASFMKGFLLQFVNIKIYMFGITALTGFITPYSKALWTLIGFELLIATIGTVATST